MADENRIGLAEMIDNLRQELLESQKLAENADIKFSVENIDLELKVQVQKDTTVGGKGGVKFWVVNAETEGKQTDTNVTEQTIKLSLKAENHKDLAKNELPGKVMATG